MQPDETEFMLSLDQRSYAYRIYRITSIYRSPNPRKTPHFPINVHAQTS